jgi:dihydroorotate dehydrogenase electron transfer subunit
MHIGKIKKGWQELYDEIIQTGKCVYCGACAAFCKNIIFDPDKEIPLEDGSCENLNTCRDGYGLCYNLCPKTEIESIPISLLDKWVFAKEQDQILGHVLDIITVKVTEKARDIIPGKAGVISSLLWTAMDEGLIDSSIITDKDEEFRPYPFIAENKSDIFKGAGYKPSQGPTLSLIGDAINKEYTDIAVVGTPCQIQALRKIQNHPVFDFEVYDLVTLTIGTFCFGTFYNQILKSIIEEKGITLKDVKKVDSDKNSFKLNFKTDDANTEIPLNYIYDKAIRKACFACSDYTASFADISVGKVGSENGWHTLIIRTERGSEILNAAINRGILVSKPLEKEKEDLVLESTRRKTELVKIESIETHSSEIRSFKFRNKRIAQSYKPGMFVILWLPDIDFLPMSVSKVEGNLLEVTVQKIGEGTSKLFELKIGDFMGIRGPFGNAFNYEDANNILIIGGGMGIAALTSIIEQLKVNKKNVFVTIGAQDEPSLIFADRLIDLIPNTICATEDGSVGRKCMVTDTIEEIINKEQIDLVITCGPEPMMKRVLEIISSKDIAIQASLERKMKCGVGLCGSCCVGEENNISVCKEGPVFNKKQLESFPQFGRYQK